MTRTDDHGALQVLPGGGSLLVPDDRVPAGTTRSVGPNLGHPVVGPVAGPDERRQAAVSLGCDGEPDTAAVVAELAVEVAEIVQRLDALVSGAAEVRARVEAVGGVLVQVCGLQHPAGAQPATGGPRPAADSGPGGAVVMMSADDLAAQAARLSSIWIERLHPLPIAPGIKH